MRMKFTGWIAIAGASVFLNSCATKPGEFQPVAKDQPHAVLTSKGIVTEPIPIGVSMLLVTQLDGKPPGARWGDHFRLSPGPHVIRLKCISGQAMAEVDLKFNAEAGQTYVARGKRPYRDVRFWIENKTSTAVLVSEDVPLTANPNARPLVVPILLPVQ